MRLRVVADDFGYCACRDEGIERCSRPEGLVTSISVLVTHGHVAGKEKCKHLRRGLHLNLTEGKPLSAPHTVPSLVDGQGMMKGKFGLRADPPLAADVRRETEKQIHRFRELFGALPSHLDGHQHVHVLPSICGEVAAVMSEMNIQWTRLPRQSVSPDAHPWVPSNLLAFFESVSANANDAASIFRQQGIDFSEYFIGLSTQGGMATEDRIVAELERIVLAHPQPSDRLLVEWMVHPGLSCRENHGDEFNASQDRTLERNLLTSASLRKRIEALGFEWD